MSESAKLTPAQRVYLTDLAEGRPRGSVNRRDANTFQSLKRRGLVVFEWDGLVARIVLTDAGHAAIAR